MVKKNISSIEENITDKLFKEMVSMFNSKNRRKTIPVYYLTPII